MGLVMQVKWRMEHASRSSPRAKNISITLVTSKSRVVPARRKITIRRVEISGNLVLAKLITVVQSTLTEETRKTIFIAGLTR